MIIADAYMNGSLFMPDLRSKYRTQLNSLIEFSGPHVLVYYLGMKNKLIKKIN